MLGDVHFALRFDDGTMFASASEVEENWVEAAVQYLEEHLVITLA